MPALMEETRNSEFARYIEELAASRPSRELSRLTRAAGHYVNPTTIADMRWGVIPTYRLLERFARGLALEPPQRSRLFRLAGYEPIMPMSTLPERIEEIMAELAAEEREAGETGAPLYQPDLSEVTIRQFAGALGIENLHADDLRAVIRLLRLRAKARREKEQDEKE